MKGIFDACILVLTALKFHGIIILSRWEMFDASIGVNLNMEGVK